MENSVEDKGRYIIAKLCKRYNMLTKNVFYTTLIESQIARLEGFIENIKTLINVLGYKVLEQLVDSSDVDNDEILSLKAGATDAKGIVTSEEFVVMSGSVINEKTSYNSLSPKMIKLREKIMSSDKMNGLTTTEDILFSSSSAAVDFVLGYSARGPKNWKTQDGRALGGDIEEIRQEL